MVFGQAWFDQSRLRVCLWLLAFTGCVAQCSLAEENGKERKGKEGQLHPALSEFIATRLKEFKQITPQRKDQLQALAKSIHKQLLARKKSQLIFVCTHNSRRSQMCQLWAAAAAIHFETKGIESYSGGTEVTAFNPRAVRALKDAGFLIKPDGSLQNPRYEVTLGRELDSLVCFSKIYSESPPNPSEGFLAIMTCSEAEKSCPIVVGSRGRFSISYEDPKVADDTKQEAAKYSERCEQIAREMLFLFSELHLLQRDRPERMSD